MHGWARRRILGCGGPGGRVARRGVRAVALLIDAGVLVAALNRADPDGAACSALLRAATPPLIVPAPVLGETCYLVGEFTGPTTEASLLRAVADDTWRVEAPTPADLRRAAELVATYADLPLGGTDALIVAVAERLGLDTVATLDRRHFSVVRPTHLEAFVLVPPDLRLSPDARRIRAEGSPTPRSLSFAVGARPAFFPGELWRRAGIMGTRDQRVERRPGTAPDLAVSAVAGALNREWRRDYEGGAVGAPIWWKTDERLARFDRAVEALATEDGRTAPARAEEILHALTEHAARGDVVAGRVLVQYLLPSLVRVSLWHCGGEQRSRRERLDDLLVEAWEVVGNGVELRSRSVRIALLRTIEYRALGRPVRQARRRAAREVLLDPMDLEQVADLRVRPTSAVGNAGEEVIDVLAEAIQTGLRPDDAHLLGTLFVGGASCREMAVIDGVTDRSVRYRRAAALRRLLALAA